MSTEKLREALRGAQEMWDELSLHEQGKGRAPTAHDMRRWGSHLTAIGAALSEPAAPDNELTNAYREIEEQARLLGMSGERELALRAEIDRLKGQQPAVAQPLKPLNGMSKEAAMEWLETLKNSTAQQDEAQPAQPSPPTHPTWQDGKPSNLLAAAMDAD